MAKFSFNFNLVDSHKQETFETKKAPLKQKNMAQNASGELKIKILVSMIKN